MYEILITTWKEGMSKSKIETYPEKFKDMTSACEYLGRNIETILTKYQCDGEITIKFKLNEKK
jgi:hypothetical protein